MFGRSVLCLLASLRLIARTASSERSRRFVRNFTIRDWASLPSCCNRNELLR